VRHRTGSWAPGRQRASGPSASGHPDLKSQALGLPARRLGPGQPFAVRHFASIESPVSHATALTGRGRLLLLYRCGQRFVSRNRPADMPGHAPSAHALAPSSQHESVRHFRGPSPVIPAQAGIHRRRHFASSGAIYPFTYNVLVAFRVFEVDGTGVRKQSCRFIGDLVVLPRVMCVQQL